MAKKRRKKKKPPINKRQKSLFEEEEKREFIKANATHYYFVWDDIEFDKGCIKLTTSRYKTIFKPILLKGSLKILNDIKSEYFDCLHHKPLKLFFFNNEFQPWLSKDWLWLEESIQPALEFAFFRFRKFEGKNKFGHFNKIKGPDIIKLISDKISKSIYLKFLARKQSETFKIIPILEYHNQQWEESFIFRFESGSGRILMVWENSKVGRATHLCIADQSNIDIRLKLLESFIIDATPSKRIQLHLDDSNSKELKKRLGIIHSINHQNFSAYKTELEFIINRY